MKSDRANKFANFDIEKAKANAHKYLHMLGEQERELARLNKKLESICEDIRVFQSRKRLWLFDSIVDKANELSVSKIDVENEIERTHRRIKLFQTMYDKLSKGINPYEQEI